MFNGHFMGCILKFSGLFGFKGGTRILKALYFCTELIRGILLRPRTHFRQQSTNSMKALVMKILLSKYLNQYIHNSATLTAELCCNWLKTYISVCFFSGLNSDHNFKTDCH